ncbi:solute carrier family 22 member 5 isoform X2 [Esox lucius]|uniref:solute carrier family 22 member 5 isoform X2 n=1 Tax=Esox lucius TaxID=8010 RepID=UPI0009734272|nr:solute carrier family 22 member 5 isoform X2 [Esox lucius]
MRDFEETTAFLGQWGPFQLTVFFLLGVSIIPNGFSAFSVIFLGDSPTHHCFIPDAKNLSEVWRKAIIPIEVENGREENSKCSRYRLDVVRNLSALGYIPGLDINLTQVDQERCVDGWTYSDDIYQSTIVTEFDLVCSESWKQPFTSSLYFLGVLCGSFFSGQLSDWFGRKPVLFGTMVVQTLFTFVQVFTQSWEMFSVLFFIVGLGQISNYIAAFVLGSEILTGSLRVLYVSLGVCLFFAFGYMMLPVLAFFLRDWRSLLLAMSVPGLVYIPLWWFIPESPRWLLSQGRVEEAEVILREAARKNRVTAPEVIFEESESEEKPKPEERHSPLDLLRPCSICKTTLIISLVWFTLSMGYFCISLNTSRLHGDPYINCFISAAIEVPAYISSWLLLRYLPRRLSTSASMLLGGAALYFIQLVPPSVPSLSIALEMMGKFGLATGTGLVFAYTAELYPTVIRNTALGFCAMISRVGSIIAPYIFTFETFGRPLPETIQQMHEQARIKCPCIPEKNRKPTKEANDTILLESSL